jgi:hypothetical protein
VSKLHQDELAEAATTALRAPSIFNTQPWRWRLYSDALELSADRGRQLTVTDPDGRLLLLSCGAALQHARVALAAAGWQANVRRLADSFTTDLLARITLAGPHQPNRDELAQQAAIGRRRTDRRPFGDEPVPESAVLELRAAAEAEGAGLHRVRLDQLPLLAVAVAQAGAQELADPAYRNELTRWANRPPWSNDGVPVETTVRRSPRRVPQRELSLTQDGMPVEAGGDRGAEFGILFGRTDTPEDWLRGGEALSAVMLTAVSLGLTVAPISDVIEVPRPRELLQGLLGDGAAPLVVLRFGFGGPVEDLADAPRRDPAEAIRGLPVR